MVPCRADRSPQAFPFGRRNGFGRHGRPRAQMFSRSEKGSRLLCRNNPDVGLSEPRHQNFLSSGSRIKEVRVSTQGSQRDRFHVRQYVRQLKSWQARVPEHGHGSGPPGPAFQRHLRSVGHPGAAERQLASLNRRQHVRTLRQHRNTCSRSVLCYGPRKRLFYR